MTCFMSPFAIYFKLKCKRAPWPLEWAKVKCNFANRKAVLNFLFDGNNNVCDVFIYEIFAVEINCKRFYLENEGQGQEGEKGDWNV